MNVAGKCKAGKVIVAGHSCLDITPMFPTGIKVNEPGDILSPGKLVQMEGVDIHAGGAVSNTGIAMKILGADVRVLTKIGEDAFGSILKNIYAQYGVQDGVQTKEGERTSYSAVLAIPGIDRIFLHDPGCNNTFSIEDVKKADLTDVVLFHFGYPPIMKRMYQNDGEELLEMLKYIKSKGIITSLDMAAVDPGSEAGRADWSGILKKVMPYVDIFVPSVEELCFMLNRKEYDKWQERAQGNEMVQVITKKDINPLAKECMKMGTKVLLLKCGAPGLYYETSSQDTLMEMQNILGIDASDWAFREGFESSFVPKQVLSGTGAGDTTIAAFLTSMISGYPFDMCVSLAAAEGASCVEDYGALGGIKPLEELKQKIEAGWEKGNGLKEE